MDAVTGIATFMIIWWLSLFLVLPIGIKSQLEAGKVVSGSERGAPAKPQILKKMLAATLVALAIWLILFVFIALNTSNGIHQNAALLLQLGSNYTI